MLLFPPDAVRELAIPSPFAYCSAATVERLPLPMAPISTANEKPRRSVWGQGHRGSLA